MEYAHIMPEDILKNPEVKVYVEAGNSCLGALGFTEHGRPHAKRCSNCLLYTSPSPRDRG